MSTSRIKVYGRMKPSKSEDVSWNIDHLSNTITFHPPKIGIGGFIDNTRMEYTFNYANMFPVTVKQDQVYDTVAAPILSHVFEGYNGTVFAYGQTSSGKTYTITGDTVEYSNRGLIPRIITACFDKIEELRRSDEAEYSVSISYLEIYQNTGFDLLERSEDAKSLFELPKVRILENASGNADIQNLAILPVRSEEDALNLLFIGDTNRVVCDTPMNDSSSRSHCIFTLFISSRKPGSSLIRSSKLHLVDLAGSERVHSREEGAIDAIQMNEAIGINMSLFALQSVIIALDEGASHVPYRNSLLTHILRDSLGGNCMTSMIATMNPEIEHTFNSISTCRFASNVARIKNVAIINESLDPRIQIRQLKQQVTELKEEVLALKGEKVLRGPLTSEEKDRCEELMKNLVNRSLTEEEEQSDNLIQLHDAKKVAYCFAILRRKILTSDGPKKIQQQQPAEEIDSEEKATLVATIKRLTHHLRNRDNEIKMLVGLIRDKGGNANIPIAPTTIRPNTVETAVVVSSLEGNAIERTQAFEQFRKSYRRNQAIEDAAQTLKEKIDEAQRIGVSLNQQREQMNGLKAIVERHRLDIALQKQGLSDGNIEELAKDENITMEQLLQCKVKFKKELDDLKKLRTEIPHLKHILQTGRLALQKDFDDWYSKTYDHNSIDNTPTSAPVITGNTEADEDIRKFYEMKEKLVKR